MSIRLHDIIIICVCISQSTLPINAFASPSNPIWTLKRSLDNDVIVEPEVEETEDVAESRIIQCGEELRSQPGGYTFVSEGGAGFCTLYLLAPVDQVVQMEFPFFNVDCSENSAVAILDGWEVDGQIFPSPSDHPQPMSLRYLPFCGDSIPRGLISSKQNIVQLMFEVPVMGQGFMIQVNFKPNPKPCNMLLWRQNYDRIALRNFGQRRNCTVMSLYPQRVQFLYVNVGEQSKDFWYSQPVGGLKSGLRISCDSKKGEDAVKVYQGHGVGPILRQRVLNFCGARLHKVFRPVPLRCHSSSVTLVSSGQFYNKVIFSFLPADQDDVIVC